VVTLGPAPALLAAFYLPKPRGRVGTLDLGLHEVCN